MALIYYQCTNMGARLFGTKMRNWPQSALNGWAFGPVNYQSPSSLTLSSKRRVSPECSLNIDRDALIPISRQDEKKVYFFPLLKLEFHDGTTKIQALSMLRRSSSVLPARWRFVR